LTQIDCRSQAERIVHVIAPTTIITGDCCTISSCR
jgi:hypothetical protein